MNERLKASAECVASLVSKPSISEKAEVHGLFVVECRDKNGKLKWKDTIKNVVCTFGKNAALDAYLAGANYTVTGPFMGLISSVSWSAVDVADTMGSHAGWKEAGTTNAPTYSGTRKTCAWSSAGSGSKSLSGALSFTFTGSGTVKGCFIVFGSGAVNTIMDANGTLYSCGTFTGGDKVVVDTDVLNVSYTASL